MSLAVGIRDPRTKRPRTRYFACVLVAIMALPLLLVPFPLLIDLPAHVARYHVERNLPISAELGRFFKYTWGYLPNLGVDLSVALLSRLMNVELAARLVAALIPAFGAAGMLWLGHRLHGRITAATLLSLPLNYAYPLIFGFVNSCFAVSLAFLFSAAWLTLEQRGQRRWAAALLAAAAPIVITAHIIGFGVLGLMIVGIATGQGLQDKQAWRTVTGNVLLKILPLCWPLIFLIFWQNDKGGALGRWFDLTLDARWLLMILRERHAAYDIGCAAALYAAALLPLSLPRRFSVDQRAFVPAVLTWACVFVMPSQIAGSEFAAVRLIAPALALSLIAVREREPLPRWAMPATLAFILLRIGVSTATFSNVSRDADRELTLLNNVHLGSRVAAIWIIECERQWEPPRYNHLGAFATVRRNAMVNGHFMGSGQQLMRLAHESELALNSVPPVLAAEPCARLGQVESAAAIVRKLPWQHIDYLWLINVGRRPLPIAPIAQQIGSTGRSRLYRLP